MEIKVIIDKIEYRFTTYNDVIDFMNKEIITSNKNSIIKMINTNELVKNYLTNNNFQLAIGHILFSSYKGMTETSVYRFSDEYYKLIKSLNLSEVDVSLLDLALDTYIEDDLGYEHSVHFYINVSKDFNSYTIDNIRRDTY